MMLRARVEGSGIAAVVVSVRPGGLVCEGQLAQVRRLGFLGRLIAWIGGNSTGAACLADGLRRADSAFVAALDFGGSGADRLVGTVCGHRSGFFPPGHGDRCWWLWALGAR